MKRFHVVLAAVFAVLLAASAFTLTTSAESGVCGENVSWTLEGGKLTLSGNGATTRFERDGSSDTTGVPWWGSRNEITSIVVEEGVTVLDNYLFYRCENLTSVSLSSTVARIETRVFAKCSSLSQIVFPEKLAYLGYEAFVDSGIKEITFTGKAPKVSSTAPFTGITANVTYNGDSAFLSVGFGGDFTWIASVPETNAPETEPSMKTAETDAEPVSIQSPEKSGKCGSSAEWHFKDGLLVIEGTGEMDKYTRNPDIDKINSEWFEWRNDIKEVVVNPGITRINNYAFYRCENLSEVTIPSTVFAVNYGAFKGCTSLKEISLPRGLNEIGSQAFAESGLEKIILNGPIPDDIGDLMADGLEALLLYPCDAPEVSAANIKVFQGNLVWARHHYFKDGVCTVCGTSEKDYEAELATLINNNAETDGNGKTGPSDGAPESEKTEENVIQKSLKPITVVNLCLSCVAVVSIVTAIVVVVRYGKKAGKDEPEAKK